MKVHPSFRLYLHNPSSALPPGPLQVGAMATILLWVTSCRPVVEHYHWPVDSPGVQTVVVALSDSYGVQGVTPVWWAATPTGCCSQLLAAIVHCERPDLEKKHRDVVQGAAADQRLIQACTAHAWCTASTGLVVEQSGWAGTLYSGCHCMLALDCLWTAGRCLHMLYVGQGALLPLHGTAAAPGHLVVLFGM